MSAEHATFQADSGLFFLLFYNEQIFMETGAHLLGLKTSTRAICVTCQKVCGISLKLNQNIYIYVIFCGCNYIFVYLVLPEWLYTTQNWLEYTNVGLNCACQFYFPFPYVVTWPERVVVPPARSIWFWEHINWGYLAIRLIQHTWFMGVGGGGQPPPSKFL